MGTPVQTPYIRNVFTPLNPMSSKLGKSPSLPFAGLALTLALLVAASCGNGEKSDIFVSVNGDDVSEVAQSEGTLVADESADALIEGSAVPSPTPIMAQMSTPEPDSPPTPEPLPTLSPRGTPTAIPTPTPSPADPFQDSASVVNSEITLINPACVVIEDLDDRRSNWDLLRSNTVSDIRVTLNVDEGQFEFALADAQSSAQALSPHIGPMLAAYDSAIREIDGEASQRLLNLRQAEESTWLAIPAAITRAGQNPDLSVADKQYDVFAALDSPGLAEAKAAVEEFLEGGCVPGDLPFEQLGALSDAEAAELAAVCAEVRNNPDLAQSLEAIEEVCGPA